MPGIWTGKRAFDPCLGHPQLYKSLLTSCHSACPGGNSGQLRKMLWWRWPGTETLFGPSLVTRGVSWPNTLLQAQWGGELVQMQTPGLALGPINMTYILHLHHCLQKLVPLNLPECLRTAVLGICSFQGWTCLCMQLSKHLFSSMFTWAHSQHPACGTQNAHVYSLGYSVGWALVVFTSRGAGVCVMQ